MATESGSGLSSADQTEKARAADAPRRQAVRRRDESQRPRKKRKRPKKPVFYSEAEVGVPDRQTLGMLGVISLMTILLWVFAKAGCNHHPPRETRRPRVVKTEEYLRDPKTAAVELVRRLGTANFGGASELAAEAAKPAIEKEKASCEANAAVCAERRKQAESVIALGSLLERDPTSAVVRVKTERPGAKQTLLVRLERQGASWKVSSFEPDDGTFKPKPASTLPFTISTRTVPPEQVPAEVRERFEKAQADKAKAKPAAPAPSPPPAASAP